MADRTFSDLSREDLSILLKKEDNLRVKLNKLDKEVKTKKFCYKIKKNPNLLDVTFCKKEDYSFLDTLPIKITNSMKTRREKISQEKSHCMLKTYQKVTMK